MTHEQAATLARQLIAQHLPTGGWEFAWNYRKRAYGTCNHRDRKICLSYHLLNTMSDEKIRDTILHEIAHALTPWDKHGPKWKAMARKLGAVPRARARMEKPENRPPYNYLLMFGDEVVAGYYRRPRRNFSTCYIPGRKHETMGQLRLVRA